MPRPNRNEIYESVIRKMVMNALEEQETQFSGEHAQDTDDQLLEYIRQQAGNLGYAPRYKEIIGWKLISERFGNWGDAIEKAGLRIRTSCPVSKLPRMEAEVEKQKEIYRQRKAEKKLQSEQRRIRQETRKKAAQQKKQ